MKMQFIFLSLTILAYLFVVRKLIISKLTKDKLDTIRLIESLLFIFLLIEIGILKGTNTSFSWSFTFLVLLISFLIRWIIVSRQT
jgi:hypothetical protein